MITPRRRLADEQAFAPWSAALTASASERYLSRDSYQKSETS
jgi:hypothetical protein